MKHKIGLRYCGGCNPRYDRGAFVRRLQAQFPNLQIEIFNADETYQAILIICGCSAQCAGQGDLPTDIPRLITMEANDYARAEFFLNELN